MNALEKPGDSLTHSWVDMAPARIRPFLRLARADRPVGTWLLLWPCWWSLALAAHENGSWFPHLGLMALFALGAFCMRGAGCAYNDIIDRDFDAKVERTKGRPLPSGQINLFAAWIFACSLTLIGLWVLLQLNDYTIWLGVASLPIVALYPFAKRFTHWPQAVLGLAFNWGALMGWAAVNANLSLAPVALYFAGVFWTLGYDTIYAHQDRFDDSRIGVKSTALRFGNKTHSWVNSFYTIAALLIILSVASVGGGISGAVLVLAACAHLGWQIRNMNIQNRKNCLHLFRSNRDFGAYVFIAITLSGLIS